MYYPSSKELYYFLFFMSVGALSYALFVFRNSFIFHHLDKMTDLIIHLLPLITMWNIHWSLRGTQEHKDWGFLEVENIHFDMTFVKDVFIAFNKGYITWAVLYYTVIMGICRERIQKRKYWSFFQMNTDNSKTGTNLKNKYGIWAAAVYFSAKHYLYCLIIGSVMMPGFFYKTYMAVEVVIYILLVVKNGADYYINYFSRKYELNLEQLDKIEKSLDPDTTSEKSN